MPVTITRRQPDAAVRADCMSRAEVKAFEAATKALTKKYTASPRAAKEALARAGILTKAGNLSKNYR